MDDFVDADAVGHRIVHFGDLLVEAELVEDWLIPSHRGGAEVAPFTASPPSTRASERAARRFRIFRTLRSPTRTSTTRCPDYVRRYAVPAGWAHITRHGFHGLAVGSIAERMPVPRLVVCHLGGGASVTAVLDGRSVDTTMGYTPLEGVPMATRSGSIDPGILLYLLRRGMSWRSSTACSTRNPGLKALGGL